MCHISFISYGYGEFIIIYGLVCFLLFSDMKGFKIYYIPMTIVIFITKPFKITQKIPIYSWGGPCGTGLLPKWARQNTSKEIAASRNIFRTLPRKTPSLANPAPLYSSTRPAHDAKLRNSAETDDETDDDKL